MKTFLEFFQQLTEKQIQYGNNANYGQVVFFAGGAASGKGFSISNFIDSTKFKIRDVDALKVQMMKMPSLQRKYPELKDLSLKNPEHVAKLHAIAKKENIPEKQLSAWINGMKYPETLPNILFDITMKDLEQVDKYVPMLINVGYKPENIHVTWVLANYSVAVVRNRTRERVVPDDIMLQTHSGAAMTIHSLLNGKLPKTINGSFTVILNNFEEVTYYDQTVPKYQKTDKFSPLPGAPLKTDQGEVLTTKVVKDFKYITLKKTKQSMPALAEMDKQIKQTLFDWVLENAPRLQIIQKSFTL